MEKILIVEDNKAMQEMLESILGEKGYAVKSADDVSTGMLLLKKENFHVILSDLQLPPVGVPFLQVKDIDMKGNVTAKTGFNLFQCRSYFQG